MKIFIFTTLVLFSLSGLADVYDLATPSEEIISGSILFFSKQSGSVVPVARVFVVSGGCTDKQSFRLKVNSVKHVKGLGFRGIGYPDDMPMISLTLLRVKGDGCLAGHEVVAVDFTAEEIKSAVEAFLNYSQTIDLIRIKFLKWENIVSYSWDNEFEESLIINPL